jgi:hypothetical protein
MVTLVIAIEQRRHTCTTCTYNKHDDERFDLNFSHPLINNVELDYYYHKM